MESVGPSRGRKHFHIRMVFRDFSALAYIYFRLETDYDGFQMGLDWRRPRMLSTDCWREK